MRPLSKLLSGTAIVAGLLAVSAVNASAAIVCTGSVCWHTHQDYEYPPSANVVVHPDDWHWGRHEHFSFREHEGRGYWSGGRWTEW